MRRNIHSRPILALAKGAVSKLTAASFLVRTLLLGLVTLAISGMAHAMSQPSSDNPDASRVVESIVAGEASTDLVPPGFVEDLGYTPVLVDGTLRNPGGSCSTPYEVGPESFTDACQTHDLGYDLLRQAEEEGKRLEARARLELDWRLYVDLLHTCDTATCSLTATAYYCAVSANSIRQGYKAPHAEPAVPWMALVVGVIGVSAAGGSPMMKARFDC